ncbi:MAG: S-layer homology domain-containing protein, partial [Nitriliruptoraceae bacterium]
AWGATGDVAWISVSHYDDDHLGGVEDVGTAVSGLEAVYDRGGDRDVKDTVTYRDYYDWVTGAGLREPVEIGDSFELCGGEVEFDVVSVGTDGTAAGGVAVSEENDRGVCVEVVYGNFDLASCGDVNQAVEDAVAPVYGQVEIVKVSHHGAAGSSSQTYVDTLAPEVAILTVGSNGYGHPDPAVLSRWESAGATLFQTATSDGEPDDGDVAVTAFSDGSFSVHGETGAAYTSDGVVEGATPDPQPLEPGCADAPAGRFADVSGPHQAGIDCIGWWGVTQGVGGGEYDPAGDVQRGQMATFIAGTLELTGGSLPSSPADAFSDDDGTTHEPAINQLAALDVIGGVGDGRYAPTRSVTRGQMATFLAAAWEARIGSALPAGGDFFTDDDGSTHQANINAVAAAGLTGGTGPGSYSPDADVSRAQMGTFLARLLAKMVADGHVDYPPANPVPITDPDPEPGCADLNSADLDQLQEIVHIGPERAQAIIDGRPWSSVEELDTLDGIGPSRLQDILDQGIACVT